MCFQLEHRQVGERRETPQPALPLLLLRAVDVFGFELQLILLLEHICNTERTAEPQPAQKTTHTAGSTSKSQTAPRSCFQGQGEGDEHFSAQAFPETPSSATYSIMTPGSGRVNFFPSSHTV